MEGDECGFRIDVERAKAMLESGQAIALDVIQPHEWGRVRGAIKGAVRIPPLQLVHRLKEKLEPEPAKPRYLQTVPWVGYRLTP